MIGTLMWIGDTSGEEFRGVVQYCLVNISQLAFRRDLAEAIARPASDVRWILFAQSNRDNRDCQPLQSRYPRAKSITIRGPLCQGRRQVAGHGIVGDSCDWHQWQQVLPAWLGIEVAVPNRCRTVAVIAATLAAAEPLLDLAESSGATAVWCRHASGHEVRNVDAVWWDDSLATAVTADLWSARMRAFARPGKPVQHAWIANAPTIWDAQQARAAGIEWLVSKPHRIEALAAMLQQPTAALQPALRAA